MKGTPLFVFLAVTIATCQSAPRQKKSNADILRLVNKIKPGPDSFYKEPIEDVALHLETEGPAIFDAISPSRKVVAVKTVPKGAQKRIHSNPSPAEVIPIKEETHHSVVAAKPAPKHLLKPEPSRQAVVLPASSVGAQQPAHVQQAFFVPPKHNPGGLPIGGVPVVPFSDISNAPIPEKNPKIESFPASKPTMQTLPAGRPKLQATPERKNSLKPIPAKKPHSEPELKQPKVPKQEPTTPVKPECTDPSFIPDLDIAAIFRMLDADANSYDREFTHSALAKQVYCRGTPLGNLYSNYAEKVLYVRECLFSNQRRSEPCTFDCLFQDVPCPFRS